MLEEPSQAEKKQRMEEVGLALDEDEDASLEDAWDDREMADDAGFSLEDAENLSPEDKKPARKSQKKVSSKKSATRKVKDVLTAEVKDVQDDDEDVVALIPMNPRKKAPAKEPKNIVRKPSRKEVQKGAPVAIVSPSPSPIDLTDTPESELKKRHTTNGKRSGKPPKPRKKKAEGDVAGNISKSKKRSHAKVLVLEDEDGKEALKLLSKQGHTHHQISNEAVDITEEEEEDKPRNQLLTPLSSIWTTAVSNDESGGQAQLVYKQDFVWDDSVFTDELSIGEKQKNELERKQAEDGGYGRERSLGKRQSRSVQQSQIRQNLMTGNLDPHTMVQCASYRSKDYVEDPNSRSRGAPSLDSPFQVVVHPDAVFVADLHAHLATCEIIGFLGGKWDEDSKTLYIQAAFPCRSLVIDGDDGSTDVEMDPGSEIELRGIIENAQLEVVGWYHSHPAFAPDPSVRDIENQTSYQQLFQRPCTGKDKKPSEPFVGLIVGTYDTRRSTPVSLFRYFHTRGEKVSGGSCREIYMPYEFIPGRRHFHSVLQDEKRERTRMFPMYNSVLQHFNLELAYVKLQLPEDIKLAPARKSTPKASPGRVRGQGSARKRKQSSENAGEKLAKKARGKSKRSSRTRATLTHVDLTDDNDDHNLPLAEKDSVNIEEVSNDNQHLSTEMVAVASDGVTNEKGIDLLNSSGAAVTNADHSAGIRDQETKVTPSSKCDEDNLRESVAVADNTKSEVESDATKVVLDTTVSTETATSEGKRKRARKAQEPKQIHHPWSSGDDNQTPAVRVTTQDESNEVALNMSSSKDSNELSNETVELVVQTDIDGVHQSSSSFSSSSSSAKPGASPTPTSGRKKNRRKPQKTTKNSNRSASPASDGPSPGRSPSPSSAPTQTFYDAFQASGPRVPNGGSQEEATHSSNRVNGPKPVNVLVEDMQYIIVEEDMKVTTTVPGGDACAKTSMCGDIIDQEVRSFVTILVEKVVEKLARIPAGGGERSGHEKKIAPETHFPVETNGFCSMLTNSKDVGSVDLKSEANALAPESIVEVYSNKISGNKKMSSNAEGTSSATAHTVLRLFGSNGVCEDIQTSLEKMAGHLEKLKDAVAAKTNETNVEAPVDVVPEKLVGKVETERVEPDRNQDAYLSALRTKYGAGVSGCMEQAITLVDYYRDFERRTDLNEIWKLRITKLEKIESSLSEYVQYLNIPVALRQDFIKVCKLLGIF
ncbi:unnamed protein product [Phytophthora fragariaefolia]|uniref:Unnamed protein product n=1 Tax=Phytophthora fragariaefolia TaxID=1490495 RepID=A0A9W6Y213_9STRA|nr:unnamed protein product [Phytophthora fragariaefolia]